MPPDAATRRLALPTGRALGFPLAFTLALAALAFTPAVQKNPRLFWSFIAAVGVLLAWNATLFLWKRQRALTIDVVLRKQHYLQACAQGSVLLYWSWYWPPGYDP